MAGLCFIMPITNIHWRWGKLNGWRDGEDGNCSTMVEGRGTDASIGLGFHCCSFLRQLGSQLAPLPLSQSHLCLDLGVWKLPNLECVPNGVVIDFWNISGHAWKWQNKRQDEDGYYLNIFITQAMGGRRVGVREVLAPAPNFPVCAVD